MIKNVLHTVMTGCPEVFRSKAWFVLLCFSFFLTFEGFAQTTVTSSIAASTDDGEEVGVDGVWGTGPGYMYLNSPDIELVRDDEAPTAGAQIVGLRFNGINIPKGATITNAYITFRAVAADAPNTNNGATNVTIKAHDTDNAGTFTTTAYNISSRITTSASVSWSSIASWTTGVSYNTPALNSVVQEVVNRNGWTSGNSMAFIITGSGSRSAESWDDAAANQPVLTIQYTTIAISGVVTNVTLPQGSDGAVDVSVSSGTSPYSYSWSSGATTQDISGRASGTYTVTVTDTNGATASSAFVIQDGFVKKQLYLSGATQLMDREDPVSVSQTLKNTATLISPSIGVLNAEYRAFDAANTYYGTYTSPDGPDRMLLVGISVRNINSVFVTNVAYNAVNMTQVATIASGTESLVYIYRLLNPPVGTYYLDVDFNTTVSAGCIIGIETLHGVHQTTPTGTAATANATTNNMSLNIASAVGDLVVSVVSKRNATSSFTTSQTQRYNAYLDQTRGAGNSTIATSTTTTLNWTATNGTGNAMAGVAIKPAGGNPTTSFTQSPAMCSNFLIQAGTITVKTYLSIIEGTMPASPNITAVLKYDAVNIITLTNPSYNSTTGLLTWTGTLGADFTVPAGKAIVLEITTNQTLVKFQIQYDHSSKPSLVEFNTTTYLDIPAVQVYSAAYPGGSLINSVQNGSAAYIRATVSDPFGFADITGLTVNIVSPAAGPFTATSVATSGCSRTYEYLWNSPSTAGDVVISATAKEGYENAVTFTKTGDFALCPITVTNSVTPLSSCVTSNGAITLNVTGPSGPYTYSWTRTSPAGSGSGSGLSLTGLGVGTYTITVTSTRGCTGTTVATLTYPAPPSSSGAITNVTCFNGSNGQIVQTITGGTSPYTYSWASSGVTTKDRTGLATGTYSVTITDAVGCTATNSYSVSQPTVLSVTNSVTDPTCTVTGSVALSTSGGGGTTPYTWNWSRVSPAATASGSGLSIAGLSYGTYTITVTSSAGCTGTTSAVLAQAIPPTVTGFITNPTCNNEVTGQINQSLTGGTSPFTYVWSDGGTTTQNRSLLSPGSYTVTINDGKNCQVTKNYTITQPSALAISTSLTQPQCSVNGSVSVTITGGISPYTTDWSDITGTINIKDRSGLQAGSYILTVTDKNGCTKSSSVTLVQPVCSGGTEVCISDIPERYSTDEDPQVVTYVWTVPAGAVIVSGQGSAEIYINWSGATPGNGLICVKKTNSCGESAEYCRSMIIVTPQVNISVSQPVCQGADLRLFSSGGERYTWTGPNGFTSESANPVIYGVNAMHSGTYYVTVTNASGCVGKANVMVTVADAPIVTEMMYNASCGLSNGFIDVSAIGGTPPYSYLWSNGTTTQDNYSLGKGNYTVTVTDASGCKEMATAGIGEVNGPSITLNPVHISCAGAATGMIELDVVGGNTPYSFYWANGSTTQDVYNLKAGSYSVTVVDVNGCADVESIELMQPNQLTVDKNQVNVNCYGDSNGSVDISVSGGIQPYTYLWSNGFTGQDRTSLSAGNVSVTVTDANLCTAVMSASITQPASALTLSNSSIDVSCFGRTDGIINLAVSGGTSPYSYSWSSTTHPTFHASQEDLDSLQTGSYRVTVTDAKGCTATSTATIGTPAVLVATASIQNASCNMSESGSVSISVSGGTLPYQYIWSNGATTSQITDIGAGVYNATIIDSKGCNTSINKTITEPPILQYTVSLTHVSCFSNSTGQIDVTVTGGTGPYVYNWSNGSTSQDISGITAGNYGLTISDAQGCSQVALFDITQNSPFYTNEHVSHVSCNGGSNGVIDLTLQGGTGPYTYVWSNGATTEDIQGLSEGAYFVTFTDANLCSSSALIIVNQPDIIQITAVSSDKSCRETTDGGIVTDVSGGNGPYTYAWSNGFSTQNLSNLTEGTYTVTVTDLNGCSAIASSAVLFPDKLEVAGAVVQNCPGQSNGTINLSITGGTSPFSYQWSGSGIQTQNRTGLNTGQYTVTVTDANGCTTAASYELIPLSASLFGVNPTCSVNDLGESAPNSDGEVYARVSGGVLPYTYLWSNGGQTESIHQLANGFYSVSISSGNCTLVTNQLLSAGSCTPPVAVDEYYVTEIKTPLQGNVSLNDYDPNFEYPLTLLPLGYIDEDIGIMEWDTSFNGSFLFTPHPDYIGTFSIPYQVCDTLNLCDKAFVHITVAPPVLGLAKTVSSDPVNNGDHSYNFTYALKVENISYININNIQITDDLDSTFRDAISYSVTNIYSYNFNVNPFFNGSSDKNLLSGNNNVAPFHSGFVYIDINLVPGTNLGPYANSAQVTGTSAGGLALTDISQDGDNSDPDNDGNPGNNSDPTLLQLCPIVNITGNHIICAGTTTTLTTVPPGIWVSSHPEVAQVNNSGVVVGISAGTATFIFIEATSGCVTNETDAVEVIGKPLVQVSGDTIICNGRTTTLSPVSGGTWISGDSDLATVSASGVVTGKAPGYVQFYFINAQTGCISDPTLPIHIKSNPVLHFDNDSLICVQTTTTVSPGINGIWVSSNPLVATITNSGLVTGVSNGISHLTFTTNEGCYRDQSLKLEVRGTPYTQINGSSSLCAGSTVQLLPSSGGSWVSNQPTVASVSSTGLVTGLTAGSATFVFTESDSGCSTTLSQPITVIARPVIQLTGPNSVCAGETTFFSSNAGGFWLSNDASVATISNEGLVTGVSEGTTTFTFIASASGCASLPSVPIIVKPKPIISFTGNDVLCEGSLSAMTPGSGGIWTSESPETATISNGGIITAIQAGLARFYYTSSSTGCRSDISTYLVVHEKPVVAVTGDATICAGDTTSIFPKTGGSWVSLQPLIASVTNTGKVTGISPGVASFVFTDDVTGCFTPLNAAITVNPSPIASLSGVSEICAGFTTTLSPSSGGVWLSDNSNVAIVSNNGIVQGIAAGKVRFSFTQTSTGCTSILPTEVLTVKNCFFNDINSTFVNVPVTGDVKTNDQVPQNTQYGQEPVLISKPAGSTPNLVMQSTGTYSFVTATAGSYFYAVPVCIPPVVSNCPASILEISVIDAEAPGNVPVAKPDRATTYANANRYAPGVPVTLYTLANDFCVNGSVCHLDPLSVAIVVPPNNGSTSIDAQGNVSYTPNPGFAGQDILTYKVCVDNEPGNCATAKQYIDVLTAIYLFENTTNALDDIVRTFEDTPVSGNSKINDYDTEGHPQVVTPQGTAIAPVTINGGTYFIESDGDFTFTPNTGFYGTTSFVYEICDNQVPAACAKATVYLTVIKDLRLAIRVYLEGPLHNNGNVKSADGRPLMRDNLRFHPATGQTFIPVQDPYETPTPFIDITGKYTHNGPGSLSKFATVTANTAIFNVTGQNALVDWVFVELRSKNDSTLVLGTRSGMLQRDGDIVDLDGTGLLRFPGIGADTFFIVVRHRNHLGVMSGKVLSSQLVDFTSTSTPIFNFGTSRNNGYNYSGLSVNENILPGYRALWAGDFDGDKKLKFVNPNDDQNILFFDVLMYPDNQIASANFNFGYGYLQGDLDMDGKAKYDNPNDDKNLLFSQLLLYPLNEGLLSNFNFFIEQVPTAR